MVIISDEVIRRLEENSFFNHMGFELVFSDKDEFLLKLPLKKELLNTNRTVHGGVHASMLDMVQSILLRSIYQAKVVAMNLDVHYFAPTMEGDLFARAKILQKGYKVATVDAEIFDNQHRFIAKGTGIYRIVRK